MKGREDKVSWGNEEKTEGGACSYRAYPGDRVGGSLTHNPSTITETYRLLLNHTAIQTLYISPLQMVPADQDAGQDPMSGACMVHFLHCPCKS